MSLSSWMTNATVKILMDNHIKGYIFAILSSLLMTSAFITNYIALKSMNFVTVTFYFFGFGLVGAVILLLVTRKFERAKNLLRTHWKFVAILGLVGGTNALAWFFALKLVGSSTLGFLMRFATVFTVGIGVFYLKEAFNRNEFLAAVIMIFGTLLMTFKGGEHIILGVVIALGISLIVSVEQLFIKNYVKHIEPIVFNVLRLLFTFLTVAVFTTIGMKFVLPPLNILLIISIGSILSAVVGFVLYFKALEISELSKVATIRSLDPFVIFVYSLIFLGSAPTGLQLAGGVLIGIGALLLVIARYRPRIIERLLPNF